MVGRVVDRQRRERVILELEHVGSTGVNVDVKGRHVTLSGIVDSYAKKLAARDAARRGAGAVELTDAIQVRLPGTATRSDAEVAAAVTRALEWDVFVPDRRIRLAVSDGKITLEGDVDYSWQWQDTLRVVRHVAGVRAIEDHIHVRPASSPGPRQRSA
ncbi:MAG TPA: BON domain-containing protein [Thermoanaerobaculia bacterium]|nr:BON domain-containing protein [Thermoanaerobaculia bacterium]